MLYVFEAFSGIGSQAKALKRIGVKHEIVGTCDWDMGACIAYDLIHHGQQNLEKWNEMTDDELDLVLSTLSISTDGKKAMSDRAKKNLSREIKVRYLAAMERSKNQVDISKLNGVDLPKNTNVLTYSFPCQDLSKARFWQKVEGGIDRDANNRSSLLWQVERILLEKKELNETLPRFLVMENVVDIVSPANLGNFIEWQNVLSELGYLNFVFKLNARDFGLPQNRVRVIMVSVNCENDKMVFNEVFTQFSHINDSNLWILYPPREIKETKEFLRTDYSNHKYRQEAEECNPNKTISREDIGKNSRYVDDTTEYIATITCKQDRLPNSGLVVFPEHKESKVDFRYLTPRECFMFMGFDESDFESIVDNNLTHKGKKYFSRDKLHKMAGNSICVNVLESVFRFINDIDVFMNENF